MNVLKTSHSLQTAKKFVIRKSRFSSKKEQILKYQSIFKKTETFFKANIQKHSRRSSINAEIKHCIKHARIRVFTDPYSPVQGQNCRFCLYTREYESVKTRIFTYFMQCTLNTSQRKFH